jgi:pyruvate,water dikinase
MFLQGDKEFEPDLDEKEETDPVDAQVLKGVAASSGRATGVARVVHGMSELNRVKPGDILVTNSTDPGWTPVFLLIRGLVLETGGILAHGTVLAREYGLPAVTSVRNATRLIKDGELIAIDGSRGTIKRRRL